MRSKGTPHVKRVTDSVELSTLRQDQIGKHHALGNDTSAGLESEGKKKWVYFGHAFINFGHLMKNLSAH